MFDKLDDLLIRFEEVLNELGEPDVTSNPDRFQKLMSKSSNLSNMVFLLLCSSLYFYKTIVCPTQLCQVPSGL